MAKILVSGLINIETTLRIQSFPIPYTSVEYPFFGIKSSVSGVGFNIAKALTILGHQVNFLSLIGKDPEAARVRECLRANQIGNKYVLSTLERTAQSIILYDPSGKRQIYVDLKDIQAKVYPEDLFIEAAEGCDILVLCNINFSRPFLGKALAREIRVASDVHAIQQLDDPHNRDFMAAADILFMSDELLPTTPQEWVRMVTRQYSPEIVVVGLGANGALLAVRSEAAVHHFPTVQTQDITSTIGAGDALFSGFLHSYLSCEDPYLAIKKAIVFASYKIGSASAAEGFLDARRLDKLYNDVKGIFDR